MQKNIAFIAQTYKLFADKKAFVKKILSFCHKIEYLNLNIANFAMQIAVSFRDNLQFFYTFVLNNLKKFNHCNVD